MVERKRKPLVLSSTKALLDSVLNSSKPKVVEDETDRTRPAIQLGAGILRLSKDKTDISRPKLSSFDDAALVGLSTSVLKRLSITSGSLVCSSCLFRIMLEQMLLLQPCVNVH